MEVLEETHGDDLREKFQNGLRQPGDGHLAAAFR